MVCTLCRKTGLRSCFRVAAGVTGGRGECRGRRSRGGGLVFISGLGFDVCVYGRQLNV